jgi:PEP-CTERM motif
MNVRFQFALLTLSVVFMGLLAPSAARATNIVTDGSFAGATSATVDPNWTSSAWEFGYFGPFDGNTDYATTGCVGSGCISGGVTSGAYLFQNLTTIPGDSYTLSFEFTPDAGAPNELEVLFGSAVAFDLVNTPDTDYVLYANTGLVATAASTQLTFLGRQDPAYDRLTGVDVEDNGSGNVTPEPSSLYLLGTGLAGLAGMLRRKLRA